jgi:DNA-binding GntR family transcriptional regulator
MPVREALRKLQAEGFVTFERRSVTVNQLSVEEVKQVFQIRLRLELLATEWASAKVTDKDITDLHSILQCMGQKGISVKEWRKLNQRFHIRFYECAQSPHIIELIKNIWDKVEPYMAIYTSFVTDFQEAQKQHTDILDIIETRDVALLLNHTTEHLEYTSHIVTEALLHHDILGEEIRIT